MTNNKIDVEERAYKLINLAKKISDDKKITLDQALEVLKILEIKSIMENFPEEIFVNLLNN